MLCSIHLQTLTTVDFVVGERDMILEDSIPNGIRNENPKRYSTSSGSILAHHFLS
jgi:hypothetical protein